MIRIIIYAFAGRTEGIMGLTFFAATESVYGKSRRRLE